MEGKDFLILARFAQKLGRHEVANRSEFAVVPVEGFNPQKVKDFTAGIVATLGNEVLAGAIFDRDYRSDDECSEELAQLKKTCAMAHILRRKELENYLLIPVAMKRTVIKKIDEHNRRVGQSMVFTEEIETMLLNITDGMKHKVQAQMLARRGPFVKAKNRGWDDATITQTVMEEFDKRWAALEERLHLVPGKDVLAMMNTSLQSKYGITITPSSIIDSADKDEVPQEMRELIQMIHDFRRKELE